jgi:hypothetical protein
VTKLEHRRNQLETQQRNREVPYPRAWTDKNALKATLHYLFNKRAGIHKSNFVIYFPKKKFNDQSIQKWEV